MIDNEKKVKYIVTDGITVVMRIDPAGYPTPISICLKTKKQYVDKSKYLGMSLVDHVFTNYQQIMIENNKRILRLKDGRFSVIKKEI